MHASNLVYRSPSSVTTCIYVCACEPEP
jgi:hypothetical protein